MSETFTGAAHGSGTTRRVAPNAPTFGNGKHRNHEASARAGRRAEVPPDAPRPRPRTETPSRHRGSTRRTGTPPPRRTEMSENLTETALGSGATRRVTPSTPTFGNRKHRNHEATGRAAHRHRGSTRRTGTPPPRRTQMSENFTKIRDGSGATRRITPNTPTFGNRKPEPPTRSARCLRHRGSTRRTGTPPPRRAQMSENLTETA